MESKERMTKDKYTGLAYKLNPRRLRLRIKWATIWRKERKQRFEAYFAYAAQVKLHLAAIWTGLSIHPGKPWPELDFMTFKDGGCGGFLFRWEGRTSHFYMLGKPGRKQGAYLYDTERDENIPYYTHPEIIAAEAICSLTKPHKNGGPSCVVATEQEINGLLAKYHFHLVTDVGESHPKEISKVWVSRLNTMLVNLWQNAPVLLRTSQLEQQKGLEFQEALDIAFEEVDPKNMKLPAGRTSDNEDGRRNVSYEGSCFYTVDRRGIACCRDYPGEFLDLSEFDTLVRVARTIYQDITGCGDDDKGLALALWAFSNSEPDWKDENLFPWERGEQEQQEVEAA